MTHREITSFFAGLFLGVVGMTYGLSSAQSVEPYPAQAPGLFSDQMNQMQTLSNSTDLYLQQQQQYWHPRSLAQPSPVVPLPGQHDGDEFRARQNRIMQMDLDRENAKLDRALAEVRHLELLNAIEGRR